MLQIYTGEGKGKSTAAFGLAMRAAGHGCRIRVIQFLKGNSFAGELRSAKKLGIEVFSFGRSCPHATLINGGFMECDECAECWVNPEKLTDSDRKKASMAWQLAQNTVREGSIDILILDEVFAALELGLLPFEDFLKWLGNASSGMEIVLTGRNAPPEVIAMAHLVSRIEKIKHPFDINGHPRRGIEY
ncbi:cob(I)yrinic acid a,c-diamide adenosyltransferase [Syntrophomonas wolfei]|uniref:cob(I)yrinic acid a,c-diamide adenosyltransferase n=1 Tax=Syntrophomonas wolfei TaxID=863 RepID=UPI0007741034|nr:cob(I)yrinic acid a,c-diamide adenosyltransferase [Syntrophomonas wolfei]